MNEKIILISIDCCYGIVLKFLVFYNGSTFYKSFCVPKEKANLMNSTFPIIHTFKWVEKAAWDNNNKKKSDGYTPPDIILTPLVLAQPLNGG